MVALLSKLLIYLLCASQNLRPLVAFLLVSPLVIQNEDPDFERHRAHFPSLAWRPSGSNSARLLCRCPMAEKTGLWLRDEWFEGRHFPEVSSSAFLLRPLSLSVIGPCHETIGYRPSCLPCCSGRSAEDQMEERQVAAWLCESKRGATQGASQGF